MVTIHDSPDKDSAILTIEVRGESCPCRYFAQ